MKRRMSLIVLCGALAACNRATDAKWAKTVPGSYAASQAGFTEQVELRIDGSFQHNAAFDGKTLVTESGKWSFDVERGVVNMEPFTSIWDYTNRRLTTNLVHRDVGALGVMRYGKAAERISPAADFDYQLIKKKPTQNPDCPLPVLSSSR